jgi:hypothetical protein
MVNTVNSVSTTTLQCSEKCVAGTFGTLTNTCCQTDDCNIVTDSCKSGSSRIDSNKLFALLFILLGVSFKYF